MGQTSCSECKGQGGLLEFENAIRCFDDAVGELGEHCLRRNSTVKVEYAMQASAEEDNLYAFSDTTEAASQLQVADKILPNGSKFTGQVLACGLPNGTGTQVWPDSSVYSGQWLSGTAHGIGKLVRAGGSGYDGQWVDGRKHGKGFEWLADGTEYTGEFSDGSKHGRGSLLWKGGSEYQGEFSQDAMHGRGAIKWHDGRSYSGDWFLGAMHGDGRFQWPDGSCFKGKYAGDKKHGLGTFFWADGSSCEGIWKDGKQNGVGLYTSPKGTCRRGRWNNGVLIQWIEKLPSTPQKIVAGDDSVSTASAESASELLRGASNSSPNPVLFDFPDEMQT